MMGEGGADSAFVTFLFARPRGRHAILYYSRVPNNRAGTVILFLGFIQRDTFIRYRHAY